MNSCDDRTRPVEEGCVWCKKTDADADDGVEFHDIDTGEQVCSVCLKDLRWFKRTIKSQFILSDEFGADVSREMFAHVQHGEDDILGLSGGSVEGVANAERDEIVQAVNHDSDG